MSRPVPDRPPDSPSLEHERARARELAEAFAGGEADVVQLVREHLPGRTEPLDDAAARYVIARAYGRDDWKQLQDEILEQSRGVEWAAREARRAIANDEVHELACLLDEHPGLLSWRDPESDGEVLLQAVTSYANFPGEENEDVWNRRGCAELLLDRGALVDPRVAGRVLETGAQGMMAFFAERGILPDNLRVRAALGELAAVRACFSDSGALLPSARPALELRAGYRDAEAAWPDPADDLAVVSDALMYASRLGQREVAAWLLERTCALDSELASRMTTAPERRVFVELLLERVPDGARFHLAQLRAGASSPVWWAAVELRLHAALHDQDAQAFARLLKSEPFFLEPECVPLQARLIEVAAYSPGALPILRRLLAGEPAIATLDDPPGSRSVSYALEYGNADYLPVLERIWRVPDDLPHAAGRGDLVAVQRWFGADGRAELGDPACHNPFPDHFPVVSVQDVLDRALAWAVQNAEYDVADFLLAHGADIDTRWGTHEPASILHECAAAGRLEQARFLVERGIDLTIEDWRHGATAQEWAEYGGHERVARFLAKVAASR